MGGYGSGRASSRPSTDQAMRLDFRPFFRRGLHRLGEAWESPQTWRCRGRVSGQIMVRHSPSDPEAFLLVYERNGVPVRDRVPIVRSGTGGAVAADRPWVACPRCRRRVAVLWGVDGWWRCRQCHGLRYASPAETADERAERAVERLRRKLGADLSTETGLAFERLTPPRPRGMRRDVYRERVAALRAAEERASDLHHQRYMALLRAEVARLGLMPRLD